MLFDINIILWLGVLNLFLILFQLLSGLRVIKIKYKLHKQMGVILFFSAFIHGIYAIVTNYI
jgi:hypothetical protein